MFAGCLLLSTTVHAAAAPAGVLMDDDAGEYKGNWVSSAKQAPIVGAGYRHDNNHDQGKLSVRFTPKLEAGGEYEVRVIYVSTENRATNTPVTVVSADGSTTVKLDQRKQGFTKGVPNALGVFRFKAGSTGYVEISNTGADGFVVVDAVQFVPLDLAKAERSGTADAGFALKDQKPGKNKETGKPAPEEKPDAFKDKRAELAASVALSPLAKKTAPRKTDIAPDTEPVALAKDVPAAEVDGKSYDVIVIGATASGVASAVRASREGCTVLLVQHNRHIGGMMSNGLMQWDALYGGPRAPLFTELLGNIEKHYIERFGKDSPDHQTVRCTHEHYPISWAESKVNEREFNRLVAGEKNITLLLEHYPVAAPRDGAIIKGVTLRAYGTTKDIKATAKVFIDATYEGDLLALAKVPFRVGREARDEYGEPHAGKAFVNIDHGQAPTDALEARLNIRPYGSRQGTVDPASPFTADGAVQAYNYRFCVTKDPANRVMLTEPPPGYNREEYVTFDRKSISTNAGPNLKSHMNSPILPGENHAYPEADWPAREKIIERHKNFALGLIWFLQNDESVSEKARAGFREWGLPRDEFADHGHIPYEMYVREARRIVGRHVLTQMDGMLARGYGRTPIQPDSIATTDWYQDSHSCTKDSRPGFRYDGKLILTEESRPAQIPYRSLLPRGVDNLLVPVCLSATHVMWGAIRLEPVWMQTGEAAGFAAAQSVKDTQHPAAIDSDKLVRTLVERQFLVSFFNDVKVTRGDSWNTAVQYFGTKGFFAGYDARPDELLDKATAEAWVEAFAKNDAKSAPALAEKVAAAGPKAGTVSVQAFVKLVESRQIKSSSAWFHDMKLTQPGDNERPLKRGEACGILYGLLRVVHGPGR